MPDGKLFIASPKTCHDDFTPNLKNYFFDPVTYALTAAGNDDVPSDGGHYIYETFHDSSVLLPIAPYQQQYGSATVMITDGTTYYKKPIYNYNGCPGGSTPCWQATEARPTDTVWEADPNDPGGGTWVTFPKMRANGIATLLPTGQVLVSGGVSGPHEGALDTTHVKTPEVYGIDSGIIWSNGWFLTNPATVTRNYHSVALLLPDGRVWTTGSNKDGYGSYCSDLNDWCRGGNVDRRERRVEYFVPWYYGRSDRPTVTCPSSMATNGGTYVVGIGNASGHDIGKMALMRAGSVTHAVDIDQRLVYLDIVLKSSTTVTVKAPYTTGAAPPGDYMLFALRTNGTYGAHIPSVACWTKR